MISFIKSVLLDLQRKNYKLEDLHFILPSRRAGVYLQHHLSKLIDAPIFSPQIISIESFIEELSGLKSISNSHLIFSLYNAYLKNTAKEDQDSFDAFYNWAQILIQDFNEIDRYNIDQDKIFDYLKAIKTLDHWHWSSSDNQTELISRHLKFWNSLKQHYQEFRNILIDSGKGYQGLIYREALQSLEAYIDNYPNRTHIFLGFNALNQCESDIVQGLLDNNLAEIYWDIDEVFIKDNIHDAGLFIRSHKRNWNYFRHKPFNWVSNTYSNDKHIEVVGIPKQVGQAKYIGQLLDKIKTSNTDLREVAVILGEENLLLPLLNSIPQSIDQINVTMGLPLKFVPLASLFELLFDLHRKALKSIYYKDVIALLNHPSIYPLFQEVTVNHAQQVMEYLQINNIAYITTDLLKKIVPNSHFVIIQLLFHTWENNPTAAIKNCTLLIMQIKEVLVQNKQHNRLNLEYLFRFHQLFNELNELHITYKYLTSIDGLFKVYKELINSETLDFKGEPLEGLQIMGVLESRVLDFETVIISSVNEGILPAGKSNNSFIPFDVKLDNGLPTFKEKDAIYTYHFYRLIQRAKNIYIIYNTEIDALKGGEKSRFITQMAVENIHKIKHIIASPEVPIIRNDPREIAKTEQIIYKLQQLSSSGFSPSSLSNYMRNPLDFYYEKILNIKAFEEVEEHIATNTLGSVIHNTLEDFYKPIVGDKLTLTHLKAFKSKISTTITKHFKILYKDGNFNTGKNLIIFEIAKRYVSNFINSEIEAISSGNTIEIIAIEAKETIELNIDGINFPVKLTGKVDRVDIFNGVPRVIDYKSGRVDKNKVEIVNWEDLTTDYDKYSKSFQVLCYAYMISRANKIKFPIEGGIISFKNLNAGFLKFAKKDKQGRGAKKDYFISEDTLNHFEIELHKLISEICNPAINFIEKILD